MDGQTDFHSIAFILYQAKPIAIIKKETAISISRVSTLTRDKKKSTNFNVVQNG